MDNQGCRWYTQYNSCGRSARQKRSGEGEQPGKGDRMSENSNLTNMGVSGKPNMPPHEPDYQLNYVELEGTVKSMVHDDRFHYLMIEHHSALGHDVDVRTPVRCRLYPKQAKMAMEKLSPGMEVRIIGHLESDAKGLHIACDDIGYRTFRP